MVCAGVGTKNATVSVTVYNTGRKPFKAPWVITMSGGNFRTVWKVPSLPVARILSSNCFASVVCILHFQSNAEQAASQAIRCFEESITQASPRPS